MVLNALSKVDITAELFTVSAAEESAENWDLSTSLNGECDILSAVGEVYMKY